MARKLARAVYVRDPETQEVLELKAGDSPSKAVADLITNPAAWGDEPADAAPPAPTAGDRASYEALKVDDLKDLVKAREVEVAADAKKADLVDALLAADAAPPAQ